MNSKSRKRALIVAVVVFLLVGITAIDLATAVKQTYPRYLYNKCINKWAVQTSKDGWAGVRFYETYVFGNSLLIGEQVPAADTAWRRSFSGDISTHSTYTIDTILSVPLGEESRFNDSSSAVNFYKIALKKAEVKRIYTDSCNAKWKQDKINAKRYGDSVFKCQHTYK